MRGDDDGNAVAIGRDVERAAGVTNFSRLKLARLQAELSRNMYSEHGLDALMRAVFLRRMPAIDGGVELHAGIAAQPGGLGDLVHDVPRFVFLHGWRSFTERVENSASFS